MIKPDPYYKPTCEACRDSGWLTIERPGQSDLASKCLGDDGTGCAWKAKKLGTALGVPTDEATSLLGNYTLTADNGAALKEARLFVDGLHPGLYIHGGVGTGKTRLLCSILNELQKKAQPARFQRVPELLLKLQPGWDEDTNAWQRIVDVPVLGLDDVGANQGTDFARRMLQTLYDARLDQQRRTIWTSNLSLDDLTEFLNDDRLSSRIAGQCKVVELGGKDWRLKKKKAPAEAKPAAPAGRSKFPFWRRK